VELSGLGLRQSSRLSVVGARAEDLGDGDGGGREKIGQPFGVDLKPAKDLEKFGREEGYI
jgi:hypothetical protein